MRTGSYYFFFCFLKINEKLTKISGSLGGLIHANLHGKADVVIHARWRTAMFESSHFACFVSSTFFLKFRFLRCRNQILQWHELADVTLTLSSRSVYNVKNLPEEN